MDTRLWIAGFSLGLVLSTSACSEVDNCEPGKNGCLGGNCASDSDCEFEKLQCVSIGARNVCAEEVSANKGGGFFCGEDLDCKNAKPVVGGGDGDGDGDGDGTITTPCSCAGADQLCVPGTTDQCINYCEPTGFALSVQQRRDTQELPCRTNGSTPVSYADACKATWRQYCLRAPVWCTGVTCDPGLLSGNLTADTMNWCMTNYPNLADLSGYCETLRDSTCETFPECSEQNPRNCTQPTVCSATCPSNPDYANDGACDDGDLATSVFAECEWGTDCGDCGPRRGPAPVLPIKIGDPCVSNIQCEGNSEDLRRNKSWCLAVIPGNKEHRCMADCTLNRSCPEGYECVGIENGDGDPIMQGDLEAGVCNPMICQ